MSQLAKTIPSFHHLTQDDIPNETHASLANKACRGGARLIQYRKKQGSHEEIVEEGKKVKEVCQKWNAVFIVNDFPEIAKEIEADGVHLGKKDVRPKKARRILGEEAIIGGTANSYNDIKRLTKEPVNYVGLGPYRVTNTKDHPAPVLGTQIISLADAFPEFPVIAIGGIEPDDVESLMQGRIHGVAVSSYINNAEDPVEAASAIRERLEAYREAI